MSPPSSARHVVLVGLMGVGKSAVGPELAERLDRPYADSDRDIEARTGRTVREIFEEDGEAAFRRLESEVLAEALAEGRPAVVAAAGGVVLDPANRRLLRERAWAVWLRADPAVLATRVGDSDHRPLLRDDPEGTLRRLAAERAPLYAEVADLTVDVDARSAHEVVEEILAAVPA